MMTLQNISFWKKFSHYLLIGLSALVLFAGVQSGMVGDFTQRGPDQVLADEDCLPGSDLGCANPGTPEEPIFPELPPPQPPSGGPSCTPVFQYNQCVACNESEPVYTNSCTGAFTSGPRQSDSACASLCQQTPPPPSGGPSCTPNDQISTTQHCQPGTTQLCTYNIWRGTDCSNGEGGPYGCVDSPQCGFTQPPAPRGAQYSACGVSGQLWDANVGGSYRPLQPSDCGSSQYLHVYPPDANGYVTNACENIPAGGEKNGDGCGWHQVAAPVTPVTPVTPACGRQEINEGCTDNGFRSFRTIDTCSGFSSARRVWDSACINTVDNSCQESVVASFCSSQSSRTERVRNTCNNIGEFTRTVFDSNCGFFQSSFCSPTEIFSSDTCVGNGTRQRVFTNSCTGGEMRRERFFDGNCLVSGPVVTQPVVQQPAVVRFATLDAVCPAGSTRTVEGNVVTCTVTAPTTFGNVGVARVVTAQAPAIAGVKELPKTGLPLLAWAALAFIPAGFKIRGFSKIKEEISGKPHFLYEERQFKTQS